MTEPNVSPHDDVLRLLRQAWELELQLCDGERGRATALFGQAARLTVHRDDRRQS